jgi:RHS repeat-associated protein
MLSGHDYYPFGREMLASGDSGTGGSRRRFTNHERDEQTGLDYMLHRYDGAALARFLSVESTVLAGANVVQPQHWNRYSYVWNNPLRLHDPDGLYPTWTKTTDDRERKDLQWIDALGKIPGIPGPVKKFISTYSKAATADLTRGVAARLQEIITDVLSGDQGEVHQVPLPGRSGDIYGAVRLQDGTELYMYEDAKGNTWGWIMKGSVQLIVYYRPADGSEVPIGKAPAPPQCGVCRVATDGEDVKEIDDFRSRGCSLGPGDGLSGDRLCPP